jgi:hypothetical protein
MVVIVVGAVVTVAAVAAVPAAYVAAAAPAGTPWARDGVLKAVVRAR